MRWVWLLGVVGYVLILLTLDLAGFPGLHGDEAWFGLEALRIQESGFTSASGMNPYTGALFPWLLAEVFRVVPPGVLALRLPGILLNTAALLILLVSVQRAAGLLRALLLFLLFGSSLLFLWMSRVAWEVTAVQPVLLATMLATVLEAGRSERWTTRGIATFLLASELGVINHLIFSAVPISFLAAAVLGGAGRRDRRTAELVWVGALAVVSMLVVLGVKRVLPDPTFIRWSGLIVVAFLGWPVAVAWWGRAWPASLEGWIERASPRGLLVALLVGVAAFAALHGIAFVGTLANVLVMKRIASWEPALPGALLGYAWGLTITGVFAAAAWQTLRRVRRGGVLATPDLITLWALGCAVALAILTGRQSLRHYVLLSVLVSVAVALSLPARRFLTRPFILVAALAFIGTNTVAWRGILEGVNRPPLRFRVGYGHEVSTHFLRLDGVVRELEELGVCHTEAEVFIEQPLAFYRAIRPHVCGTDRVYRLRYCGECPPSYIFLEPTDRPLPSAEGHELVNRSPKQRRGIDQSSPSGVF